MAQTILRCNCRQTGSNRRDNLVNGVYAPTKNGDRGSATWWIDYSNFFEGIGALGGGNVTLNAGRDVKNVDAVAPTNAWSPYQTNTVTSGGSLTNMSATSQPIFEFGGGDVVVSAGRNINGGVYYVERGLGILNAGGNITTNQTRSSVQVNTNGVLGPSSDPITWLPTTLFLGKGGFEIAAEGDILLGQVANPFLLPMEEITDTGIELFSRPMHRRIRSTYRPWRVMSQ